MAEIQNLVSQFRPFLWQSISYHVFIFDVTWGNCILKFGLEQNFNILRFVNTKCIEHRIWMKFYQLFYASLHLSSGFYYSFFERAISNIINQLEVTENIKLKYSKLFDNVRHKEKYKTSFYFPFFLNISVNHFYWIQVYSHGCVRKLSF